VPLPLLARPVGIPSEESSPALMLYVSVGGDGWMPSVGEKDRGGDGGLKVDDDE
jgi:hypothetical protein